MANDKHYEFDDIQIFVDFSEHLSEYNREDLVSGENLAKSLGKLSKWYAGGKGILPINGANGNFLSHDSMGPKWVAATDIDKYVKQSPVSAIDTNYHSLLIGYPKSSTRGFAPSEITEQAYTTSALYVKPDATNNTATLYATDYIGKINGFSLTGTSGSTYNMNTFITSQFISSITTTGNGNGVTAIGVNNGVMTVTKGSTFALDGHTHPLSIATDTGDSQLSMSANTKYKLTAGGSTFIFTTPQDSDTKVTSSANHYTPATASGQDKTASASGATAAWSIDVVKGVTLNTDGKGHVTGISVTSGKIPANPIPSNNVTGSGTSGYLTKWSGTNTITNGPQLGSSTTTFLRNDGTWATPVNSGTANCIAYYSGANAISSAAKVTYVNANNSASTPATVAGLHIESPTYGNTATNMIGGVAGVFSYGDGGPQIRFKDASSSQAGALIFTADDAAASGTSWHFVSNETDWNVISKRFHAKTSISIGTDKPSTSYNLTVNGTSYFDNTITIKGTSSGNASIYYASYGNTRNTASIRFYDGDVNGQGIQIGGGGLTVIGGGESAQTVFDNLSTLGLTTSSEAAVIASDGPIYFYTNVDTGIANRKAVSINTSGYLNTYYINMATSDEDNSFSSSSAIIYSNSDKYLRRTTFSKLASLLQTETTIYDGHVIHQNDYNSAGFTRPVHRFIRDLRPNKLAFTLPANITMEYSTNAGSSWTSFGYTDAQKAGPFISRHTGGYIAIGPTSGERTTSMQTRITITNDGRDCFIDQFYIWMSTSGHGTTVDIQYTTQSAKTTWVDWRMGVGLGGWAGPNIINVSELRYGNTIYSIRFTFKITSIHADYKTQPGTIYDIQAYGGMGCWGSKNNMMTHDSLFTWDYGQNATFPANVSATKFIGPLQGNADTATTATKLGTSDVGNGSRPIYLYEGTPTQCDTPASGAYWAGVPYVGSNGVIEIGKYIDFHASNTTTNDYDYRITVESQTIYFTPKSSGDATYNLIRMQSPDYNQIQFQTTKTGKAYTSTGIVAYPLTTSGQTMLIQSDGNTVVGGGESPRTLYSNSYDNMDTAENETLYLASDSSEIHFITNCQAYSGRKVLKVQDAQLVKTGGIWISARDNAPVYANKPNAQDGGYYPAWFAKTKSGGWSMGVLSTQDNLYITYTTDTDYSGGSNANTYQVQFQNKSGTVALTSDLAGYVPMETVTTDMSADTYFTKTGWVNWNKNAGTSTTNLPTANWGILLTKALPSVQVFIPDNASGLYFRRKADASTAATAWWGITGTAGNTYNLANISNTGFGYRTLNATTVNTTAGSFVFGGDALLGGVNDWAGIQVEGINDRFQLLINGHLLVRQNDDATISAAGWTAWTSCLRPADVSGSGGITVTQNDVTIGSGSTAATYKGTVTISHSNSITASTSTVFKKFSYDANGHITGTAAVAASDIPALNYVPNTQAGVNAAINLLSTGTSTPTDADYYISQYVGGGTTTTTYHRRPMSALWSYVKGKADSIYAPLSHTHAYTVPVGITIKTGSSDQSHITLQTLMAWLITTKGYITSNAARSLTLYTSWSYAGNDILQLTIDGTAYELQLAGVIIEFDGYASDYQTGTFRLRIHSSPTVSFTPASGYTQFPASHIAEYTCNGSSYSPTWKMLVDSGDKASTSAYGITKLYDGVDSTSTSLAATANAVKTAYDKGNHSHPYLPLSGGTMTGTITHPANTVAINLRDDSTSTWQNTIMTQSNGDEAVVFANANARTSWMFVNGEDSIAHPENNRWQSLTPALQIKGGCVAIGKLIPSGTTPTTRLDIAGSTALTGDIQLKTSGSSSDDSGDIIWYYGNGNEKMRIWTDNTYTAAKGPNYRVYKSDGTLLYSGNLPLADGTGASGTWGISVTGTSTNVTGTVAIANGGTGATTRLNALKNLTNENVGTSAQYFLTITDSWNKGGYTTVADAKTVLGLKSAAYTESSAYLASSTKYAGSSSVGGAATSANVLNKNSTAGATTSGVQYVSDGLTIGTADGNAKEGSNASYKLWSYPAGGTATSSTSANIQNLRLYWNTNYFRDIFTSPNNDDIYHRAVYNGSAHPWRMLLDTVNIGGHMGYGYTSKIAYDPHTGRFTSTNTSNAWDQQAWSNMGYTRNVFVTFKAGQTTMYAMIGLDSNPTQDAGYANIDYCWYLHNDGTLQIYESGTAVSVSPNTYSTNDEFRVEYDGHTVRYYHNGALRRWKPRDISGKLYFDSCFYNAGSIYDFEFGTTNVHAALTSTGYSSNSLTYRQSNDDFGGTDGRKGSAGDNYYAHYIIANHGNGETYYHYTLRLPFWGGPQYQRKTGGSTETDSRTKWYDFITEENYSSYALPLSGGTMTGVLTTKGGMFEDAYNGALNMNNSDIYGLNSIYTADPSDGAAEGIHFYRDTTHVDTLWMSGGSLLFVPNRELGTSTTAANSQKVARFTANPTSGQIVVTDGTTGGVKTTGYTTSSFLSSSTKYAGSDTVGGVANNSYYLGDSTTPSTYKLRYINSNDVTTWTSSSLAATDSIAVIRGSVTDAWATGHIVTFNVASVGTPFQIGVHDSSELYFYKRYKSGSTWSGWTKMNAGSADYVKVIAKNEIRFLNESGQFDYTNPYQFWFGFAWASGSISGTHLISTYIMGNCSGSGSGENIATVTAKGFVSKTTSGGAGCTMQYNSSTQSLDFIFS